MSIVECECGMVMSAASDMRRNTCIRCGSTNLNVVLPPSDTLANREERAASTAIVRAVRIEAAARESRDCIAQVGGVNCLD